MKCSDHSPESRFAETARRLEFFNKTTFLDLLVSRYLSSAYFILATTNELQYYFIANQLY